MVFLGHGFKYRGAVLNHGDFKTDMHTKTNRTLKDMS